MFGAIPGKTLPIAFVIVLAVSLVASIVTIVHSIDLTIFTLYGYNRYLTGITPRNALVVDEGELAKIRRLPELGHLYPSHSYQTMIKTIFGKMVLSDLRTGARGPPGADGSLQRAPRRRTHAGGRRAGSGDFGPGGEESGSEDRRYPVAPGVADSYAPLPIRLVGLLHGPVWLGLTSKARRGPRVAL